MKIGLLTHDKALENNKIFDYKDKTINRDNGLYPCYLIKKIFESKSIKFNTIDTYYESDRLDYVFYFKYDENVLFKHRNSINVYFAWEPEVVDEKHSKDQLKKLAKQFDYIMTWNDDIVDNNKYFKVDFFYFFEPRIFKTIKFENKKLLTNISGNKCSKHKDELYTERLKVIEYFEENYTKDFEFYGMGWNEKEFKTYKGTTESKFDTYQKYKFALCLENMHNIKGYITEKLLDCFDAKIVPIYKGASNIGKYIPESCYIDYDKYESIDVLYKELKQMTEEKYNEYISAIELYLKSAKKEKFSAEMFVKNVEYILNKNKNTKIGYFYYFFIKTKKAIKIIKKIIKKTIKMIIFRFI